MGICTFLEHLYQLTRIPIVFTPKKELLKAVILLGERERNSFRQKR